MGQTKDPEKRLAIHNSNKAGWTKRHQPWVLVHKEEFMTRSEALIREKEIKVLKDIKKFLTSI
ncbi:MAG: GIY-YIG nuclease family protein [Ignavibacteria bacterium]|nr:GIY-YIG nuclease family protein [Ignavibacteria bacterium]MCC7158805.1 GIY-YIG nuclease family protein [Ignavibacteria bacterium]